MDSDDQPQPASQHATWFTELPKETRLWLENLRKEDLDEFREAMKMYRTVNSGGRFLKWVIITIIAGFVGAAAFGEALQKIFNWSIHIGKP